MNSQDHETRIVNDGNQFSGWFTLKTPIVEKTQPIRTPGCGISWNGSPTGCRDKSFIERPVA